MITIKVQCISLVDMNITEGMYNIFAGIAVCTVTFHQYLLVT